MPPTVKTFRCTTSEFLGTSLAKLNFQITTVQVFKISPAWSRINKYQRTLCVPIGINITHDILKLSQISLAHRHVKLSNNFEIIITIFIPKTSTNYAITVSNQARHISKEKPHALTTKEKIGPKSVCSPSLGALISANLTRCFSHFVLSVTKVRVHLLKMEIFCTTECSLCKTLTKINIRSYKYVSHN